MPKVKGRGKVIRTRTIVPKKGRYIRCDVYEKAGPRGGKAVCGPVKKTKSHRGKGLRP